MGSLLLRLRTWWETADRTQKVVTVFGSIFLVALIFGTIIFAGRPKMDMLFGGLTPAEQGSVNEELQKLGIPSTIDARGNIFVPGDKVAEARSRLATSGKLPQSGHSGIADLEKLNMMTTPTVERERLKTVAEGELAKSIEGIQGVAAARVHLSLAQRGPFMENDRPATASVLISEVAGDGVSPDEARAISRMISNAVSDLKPENVTIMNNNGQLLWDGATETGVAGRAEQKVQAEIVEARRRRAEIQAALDSAFGPGTTVVTVNVMMDYDKQFINQVENTPSESPIQVQKQEETLANANNGALGAGAPIGAPATPDPSTEGQGYRGSTTSQQFLSNQKESRIEKAAGTLTSMSINVLVNSKKIEDPAPVDTFVQGYLQPWSGDAKFVGTVTSVEFDTTQQAESQKAAAAAASRDRMQQMVSLLPIVALFLVGFIVIKAVQKSVKSSNVMVAALPGGQMMTVGMGPMGVEAGPTSNSLALSLPEGVTPETATPEQLQKAIKAQEIQIDDIPDVINVPLEQIRKMSMDRPQAVAMLMKSWLLEEKK